MRRHFAVPGYVALATAIALAVAWPAAIAAAQWWPLLAGLVLLGLPHGAVDHRVPARLGRPMPLRRFVAGYVALAGLVLALWWFAPGATLVVFLTVAVVHWGSADVWFARFAGGRAPFARRRRLVAFVAARGLLPVALPVLAQPQAAAEGFGALLGAVGADAAVPAPGGLLRGVGLVLVAAAVVAAVAASIADHRGRRDRRALQTDLGELALLTGTFAVVPPVFAVGVYFVVWHALRHAGRLIVADPAQARLLADHRPVSALARWHVEAAPLTAISLAGLALLAALVWQTPATGPAVSGAALALIAALTVPHAVVVGWMDRVQLATMLRAAAPSPEGGFADTGGGSGRRRQHISS